MLLDLLAVAVLGFVGFRLVTAARVSLRPGNRGRVVTIVRGIRLRHVVPVPIVLTLVLVAATLLMLVPGLDFGWWTAIGGVGNPVSGGTERTTGTALEWVLPVLFLLLLLPALPLFAYTEERLFRRGDENRTVPRRLGRGVVFGLVHAIVGIPIGVAIALSIGGWYFSLCYMRGYRQGGPSAALLESTRAHVAYNGFIVVIALVAAAFGAA